MQGPNWCAHNYLVSGIVGKVGAWIDNFRFKCSRIAKHHGSIGDPFYFDGATGVTNQFGTSESSQPFNRDCPSGQALTWIQFNITRDGFVNAIRFQCRNIHTDTVRSGDLNWIGNPDTNNLSMFTQMCPGNMFATGANINADRYPTAIGLFCMDKTEVLNQSP